MWWKSVESKFSNLNFQLLSLVVERKMIDALVHVQILKSDYFLIYTTSIQWKKIFITKVKC